MKMFTIIFLFSTLLAGCLEKKQPPSPEKKVEEEVVRTVSWYKENKEELKIMLAKCDENPGELMETPNCINAAQAQAQLDAAKRGGLEVKPLGEEFFKALRKKNSTQQ